MRMSAPIGPHKLIDIAFNATDSMFKGAYHGKPRHADDLAAVLVRARTAGVTTSILTGGSLSESKEALELAEKHGLYSTVGLHPTRTSEMDEDSSGYLAQLSSLIEAGKKNGKGKGRVVAIGECGLDYDRLHFSPLPTQITHFTSQLSLARQHRLPLFLHSRHPDAHTDLVRILHSHREDWEETGGVVHSFTGTVGDMEELVGMGLYIGINGCGLKTEEGLEMIKRVPLGRLMLETDAPYCTPTSSHASNAHLVKLPTDLAALYGPPSSKPEKFKEGEAVKGRMEPCGIGKIAWVVAQAKGLEMDVVCKAAYENTIRLFGLGEDEEESEAGGA